MSLKFQFDIFPYRIEFNRPAKTSRNTFDYRDLYIIRLRTIDQDGWGESAPLKLLSKDDLEEYPLILQDTLTQFAIEGQISPDLGFRLPSVAFGIETALNDLQNGSARIIFKEAMQHFPIPINGLVWMEESEQMLKQGISLVQGGFDCIKFKVGALDFEEECRMLEAFRKQFDSGKVMIRLDANGAFHPMEVREQLRQFRKFGIHSIEQPIRAGQWDEMSSLVREKIIPVALDEELIPIASENEMVQMLRHIRPDFIILKPSLHGGYRLCLKWIQEAIKTNTGYWMTSALESNIGLNGIAQFTALYGNKLHQGLGTGSLYKNNIPSPLTVRNGWLYSDIEKPWNFESIPLQSS